MTEDELKSAVQAELRDAMGGKDSELSERRQLAMDYYFGRAYGDESEDRSSIVTREFFEATANAMAPLMRIFTGSGKYVEFDPMHAGDIAQAEVDTEAVRHVFTKQNNGFWIAYSWMLDALRQANGVVKCWYESDDEVLVAREAYTGLTDDEIFHLDQDPEIEILEHTEQSSSVASRNNGQELLLSPLHDVVIKRIRKRGQVFIENIPPEDTRVSSDSRSLDLMQSRFVSHSTTKTVGELRAMGVSQKILDRVGAAMREDDDNEAYARAQVHDELTPEESGLVSDQKPVDVHDCRYRIDFDGDGIEEYRRILMVGNEIVENDEAIGHNRVYFCSLSPFPQPHKFVGMGFFDLLEDQQHVSSVLLRNSLDAIFKANENRTAYWDGHVDFDDLADRRFDGLIACTRAPQETLFPIPQQNIPPQTFDLINRVDQVIRRRTGTGEGVTGVGENVLAHAKTGVIQTVNERGSDQIELIARIFAETGFKDLFLAIHRLLRENHYHDLVFRHGAGDFVATSPTSWEDRTSLTVRVGLGSGDKDRDLAINQEIRTTQQAIVQAGGMNTLVTPTNIYNSLSDLVELAGKKDPDRYFTNPVNQPVQPQQPQQQSEGDAQAQAFLEAERMKAQVRAQSDQVKAQLQQAKQQADDALKRFELAQSHLEKMTELELKYSTDVPGSAV